MRYIFPSFASLYAGLSCRAFQRGGTATRTLSSSCFCVVFFFFFLRYLNWYRSSRVCTHNEGISRSGSTVPLILNLGITWRLVVSFVLSPLYPHKKRVPVSSEQKAGWAPEPVRTLWSRQKSSSLAAISNTLSWYPLNL
jgi:hypothetical protein